MCVARPWNRRCLPAPNRMFFLLFLCTLQSIWSPAYEQTFPCWALLSAKVPNLLESLFPNAGGMPCVSIYD
mgnify:CR=1 FL=1